MEKQQITNSGEKINPFIINKGISHPAPTPTPQVQDLGQSQLTAPVPQAPPSVTQASATMGEPINQLLPSPDTLITQSQYSQEYQAASSAEQSVYHVQMQVQLQPIPLMEQQYQQPQLSPAQPSPPSPCFPRVQESNTNEKCDIFDNTELIFYNAREHMKLLTIVDKVIRRNSGAIDSQTGVLLGGHSKTKSTAHAKLLSNGCVNLIRVYCPTDERGNKSPLQCEVEIIYQETIGRISLPVDAIRRKDKSVLNALANEDVTFIDNGFRIWCEKFSEQLSKAKVHIEHTGFYKDENDRWCHVNAGYIALHAVDSQGILDRLGIDFSIGSDDAFLRLALFFQGVIGRIFTVVRSMNVSPIAKLAIVYPERGAALEDLKALYCTDSNPPLYPGKLFENQISAIRDGVALISLSESDYMNGKCLETLSRRGSELTALPPLLSENDSGFSKRNDVLQLNYDITGIGDINGELCWAIKVLLNEPRLSKVLPEKFDYYCTLVEEDTETASVQHLIALLLSRPVFDHTAKKCGTTRAALANTLNEIGVLQGNSGQKMRNFRFGETTEWMYALDCSALFEIGELRPMCANNYAPKPLYQIPIGAADNYDIYFDIYPYDGMRNNPFALITGAIGTGKSTLCKTLAVNAAMLNLSVVSIGVETSALDLDCNIFEPGEEMEVSVDLFFETLCIDLDEGQTAIADTALELMLEQDYSSYDEMLATFTGLVDNEESAESLLTTAREAADKLSGFSWDKAVVDGKISQMIAQKPEEADKLLSDFFDYKVKHKSENQYTLLLLDEARVYSWDGNSALVSKIICQGRKFGIVGGILYTVHRCHQRQAHCFGAETDRNAFCVQTVR